MMPGDVSSFLMFPPHFMVSLPLKFLLPQICNSLESEYYSIKSSVLYFHPITNAAILRKIFLRHYKDKKNWIMS